MKNTLFLLAILIAGIISASAAPVHVLIWDERQPRQAEAYDNFLGNEIAKQLKATTDDLEIRSISIDDPEQGLTNANLDWADVLIWWGHARQKEVTAETSRNKLIKRLSAGTLNIIVLHSAHWSTPFMEAMNERTRTDAKTRYPDPKKGKKVKFEFLAPPGRMVPAAESVVTPAYYVLMKRKIAAAVRVDLPNCCFPDYRADGKPSTITVKLPDHPIAKGLPKTFQIPATEMYNEPFHVPTPDEVVFEEDWALGEHFRSGMVWNIGKGRLFYFRPGHETYPIFKQPEMIQILGNASRWLGTQKK
ncbi:ThuA domain-containing protein [bacterium]|nr:ThuA domain-containing protein [bacterium]